MKQTHILSLLKFKNNSVTALWSNDPNGGLIVFIHGFRFFGNNPAKPWNHFLKYIQENKEFSKYDILFYGYDSKAEVSVNKYLFSEFLNDILTNPNKYYRKSNISRNKNWNSNERCDNILIVAHSLGALVSRWALTEFYKQNSHYANKCRFILFAPAHNGEKITSHFLNLARELNLSLFAEYFKFMFNSLEDLKQSSNTIEGLKTETLFLIEKNVKTFTIAIQTVWAELENVVKNDRFCSDVMPPEIIHRLMKNLTNPTKITWTR